MKSNPHQLAPCNWPREHFPWPPSRHKSGVCTCGDNRWWYVKLWRLLASRNRLDSSLRLITRPINVSSWTWQMFRETNEDFYLFSRTGRWYIRLFIYAKSLCRPASGASANSTSLFWGYCSNLVSQADKGIHLTANPFSDLYQVSEAHPVRSKYVCCLIFKILPA